MPTSFVHWNAAQCPACAMPGTRWEFLATAEQTEGGFAVVEITADAGKGPPLHRHPAFEAFYVLRGTFEFTIGSDHVVCDQGGFVTIPSNDAHRWRNSGTGEGVLLCFITPAGMENYFAHLGRPIAERTKPRIPTSMAATLEGKALAEAFGVEILDEGGG